MNGRLGLAAVVGLAGLTIGTLCIGWVRAQEAQTVSAAGVTLRSVRFDMPVSERAFPAGAGVDTVSANCLTCHSAGMVMNQPGLTEAVWRQEVQKMRSQFKAPIEDAAVPEIVAYLVSVKGAK